MDEKLKAFWAKLNTDVKTLWSGNKMFLIGFGLLILIVKFRNVIIDLLVANSKTVLNDAVKKDTELKAEEDKANNAANKLVDEAKKLSDNKPTVDEDWYKNGK